MRTRWIAITLCAAFAVAGQSADVDVSAPYSSETRSKERGNIVITFSLEKGDGKTPCAGCGKEDSEPGSTTSESGGKSSSNPRGDALGGEIVGKGIFGPVVSQIIQRLNQAIGGPSSSAAEDRLASQFAREKAIDLFVRTTFPETDAKIGELVVKQLTENRFDTTTLGKSVLGDWETAKDEISNDRPLEKIPKIPYRLPSHDQLSDYFKGRLAGAISKYKEVAAECNEGVKLFGPCSWPFDELDYVKKYADLAQRTQESLYSAYVNDLDAAIDSAGRQVEAKFVDQIATNLSSRTGLADIPANIPEGTGPAPLTPIPLDATQQALRNELAAVHGALASLTPTRVQEARAIRVGLVSSVAGERALERGDNATAEFHRDVAFAMLDIATGFLPGVSWARDVYEATTGRDLITDAVLSDTARFFAVLGVVTVGAGSKIAAGTKVVNRVSEWVNRATGIWSKTSKLTSVENAFAHWVKHGKEFPELNNAKEYVEMAHKFLKESPAGTLAKVTERGDVMKYHPPSNVFGVLNPEGLPKTMFKPDLGPEYWKIVVGRP